MFGDVVRGHRRRLGMTQEELAERAGVNVRTIGKIEAGRIAVPRPATLRLLADAFGLHGQDRDRFCAAGSTMDDPSSTLEAPKASETGVPRADVLRTGGPWAGVPRQAPASLADFTGRHKELRQIHAMLAEEPAHAGASVVVSISGMAGVGKTTLAVRAAHDLRDRFPGGCLFADLRGADPAPAPAPHVLGSFLRACGIRETLPSNMDERVALYRTVLAGRRMLVVLDNAASEDQVRPLLPGAGTGVLITSRRSLGGLSGAHLIHLETFPATDSIELLAAVAGRDRVETEFDAAQRVAQLCGGLPLALRVAAVRLAQHDNLLIGALSERLADERERLDELAIADVDVRASLALSYRQLTPQHRLLLDALCVLPLVSVPSWLVTQLLEVSPGTAGRLLEELSAAQLLISTAPDRYQIHDLIRVFGRERAASDARQAGHAGQIQRLTRRACVAMLDRIRVANAALPCRPLSQPTGDTLWTWTSDPVEFLTAELANVVAAIRFAVGEGDAALAAQLAGSIANFCLMRGYVDEWEHSHQLVLEHASSLDSRLLGMVELGMGTLRRFQDRNREALTHLRWAYRLLHDCSDRVGEANALLSWGIAVRTLGRVGFARRASAAALAMLRDNGPPTIVTGYALLARHHLDRDLESLRQALAVFEAEAEHWGAAEVHTLLAARLRERGDLDDAARHVHLAIATYTRLGDLVNLTVCELSLARIHMARSEDDKAARLLKRALRTAEQLRHPWARASAHRLLGQLMLAQADPAGALPHLQHAVALMRHAQQPTPLASALELLARAHAALGQTDAAREACAEGIDLLTELNPEAASALADLLAANLGGAGG